MMRAGIYAGFSTDLQNEPIDRRSSGAVTITLGSVLARLQKSHPAAI
jgi:hypothetical protein